MIDRSHLKILREIERQGSLTKAASALHLTQSALSHKIKNLESIAIIEAFEKLLAKS